MNRIQISLIILLLVLPSEISGGPICTASCCGAAATAALVGSAAILPALGFTSSGIAAGSWAATWMASFAGAVPAGSLFATLQSAGVAGASWSTITGATGGVTGICVTLCAALP